MYFVFLFAFLHPRRTPQCTHFFQFLEQILKVKYHLTLNVFDFFNLFVGREDLMDRGVLEAKQLEAAFVGLEKEKGGTVTAIQDLLSWPVISSAIEDGVVSCLPMSWHLLDIAARWLRPRVWKYTATLELIPSVDRLPTFRSRNDRSPLRFFRCEIVVPRSTHGTHLEVKTSVE